MKVVDSLFSFDIVLWNRGLGPLGLHSSVVAIDSDAYRKCAEVEMKIRPTFQNVSVYICWALFG